MITPRRISPGRVVILFFGIKDESTSLKGLTYLSVGLVASARTTTLPAETIAAVYGSVTAGPERHRGFISALGADNGMHLSRTTVKTEAVRGTVGTPCLAARGTTLRLVRITLFGMIRLIVGREDERLSALHACKIPILVAHR